MTSSLKPRVEASAKKNSAAAGNSQIGWGHYSAELEHASAFFL
jgi:hypothetical protein